MFNNELKHYGVPGMKWGVRRSSGEIRAAKSRKVASDLGNYKNAARGASDGFREASNAANTISRMSRPSKKVRKEMKTLSDQELKSRVNRLNMEQQYANLNPSRVSRGASYAGSLLSIAGSVAAIAGSAATVALAINQLKQKG